MPVFSQAQMMRLIERRNSKFEQAIEAFLARCLEEGLDPEMVLKSEREKFIPQPTDVKTGQEEVKLTSTLPESIPRERKSIPEIVQELKDSPWYTSQIVPDGHRVFDAQEAVYGDLNFMLSQDLVNALYNTKGITQFYAHQADAINALHEGHNVVVATSTSSGKSLIYQLPVLHALEQDHHTRAMYIFPTKALAQDQRRSLKEMMSFMPGLEETLVETFDGDTPMTERNIIREEARIIFTNPDMLHITILPREDYWRTFLKNLKYVVGPSLYEDAELTEAVDELHYYNGLMGSHVAYIMRRLRRTCAALGNRHVKFISCSATVANPEQHFKTIFGIDDVRLVDFDGSPSDPGDPASGRGNAMLECSRLFCQLILRDQHYMQNPDELFTKPNCELLVDLNNMLVKEGHLQCAAYEMPIQPAEDAIYFGSDLPKICEERLLKDDTGFYHCHDRFRPFPSKFVSIRDTEEDHFAIIDITHGRNVVLEELEASRATFTIYDGAIFLHQGDTYLVRDFNPDKQIARVERVKVDWLTSQRDYTDVDPIETEAVKRLRNSPSCAYHGTIRIKQVVFGYFKVDPKRNNRILDAVQVDNPPVSDACTPAAAIHAAQHALMSLIPNFVVSAPGDVRTECKSALKEFAKRETRRKRPARLTFYDAKGGAGGSGINTKAFEFVDLLLRQALDRVMGCACEGGCVECCASELCKEMNAVMSKAGCEVVLKALLDEEIDVDALPMGPEEGRPVGIETVVLAGPVPAKEGRGLTVEVEDVLDVTMRLLSSCPSQVVRGLGSLVEIIMFIVLITRSEKAGIDYIQVIQAAILGSVLATLLLCLGLCFMAAGMKRDETHFSEAVGEAGNGLLLTAGFGLAIPTVFEHSLSSKIPQEELLSKTIDISRSTAVLLMVAYFIYIFFHTRTHHGIYDAVFVADEARDDDGYKERMRHRLTLTECILALAVSIALVTIIAIALVDQIHFLVEERHVSDAFVGLILVPLVEKAAEHLTAVDEAYDNQMNFALSHVLGATLQTALFNGPLVVIVGWGLGKPMGLNFEVFDVVVLLLAIITVGNFLRDQKCNYLEGALCVLVYVAIAVAALYYPNPHTIAAGEGGNAASSGDGGHR
ncbi:ATP-dependent 3'-5' DNA helicase [Collariella sp. IMI 366227]|nr:ATP-dependent 3'-5' DNA helicase [Collariella sp. IMI 366227]